jgi:hypothetical protein
MEDIDDFWEDIQEPGQVFNTTRDSLYMSEIAESVNLMELVTELFVVPNTYPSEYNIK